MSNNDNVSALSHRTHYNFQNITYINLYITLIGELIIHKKIPFN